MFVLYFQQTYRSVTESLARPPLDLFKAVLSAVTTWPLFPLVWLVPTWVMMQKKNNTLRLVLMVFTLPVGLLLPADSVKTYVTGKED